MSANDLLGKPTANKIFEKVRREAEEQAKQGWKPKLVSITIGDTDAVDVYVRNQRRSAEKCNIEFEEKHIPASISQDELKVMIRQMNTNPSINGIIIQRPVPKHINTKEMQTYIHPLKDFPQQSCLEIPSCLVKCKLHQLYLIFLLGLI